MIETGRSISQLTSIPLISVKIGWQEASPKPLTGEAECHEATLAPIPLIVRYTHVLGSSNGEAEWMRFGGGGITAVPLVLIFCFVAN